jgi:molybdenum cofactor synthesis domain-containing protein
LTQQRIAFVLTVSDGVAGGSRADESGDHAADLLTEAGFVVERGVVPDEMDDIVQTLRRQVRTNTDLIVSTGGTGLGPRDVTPEASAQVIDRHAPGIAEMIRAKGVANTPHAALSRGLAGVAGRTLIVNLPGSTKAVEEGIEALLPVLDHALELLSGHTEHSV